MAEKDLKNQKERQKPASAAKTVKSPKTKLSREIEESKLELALPKLAVVVLILVIAAFLVFETVKPMIAPTPTPTAIPTASAVPTVFATPAATAEPTAAIANPASVNCVENGGTLDLRTNDLGAYGVCIFPDGSQCEEWAFFSGRCVKGNLFFADFNDRSLSSLLLSGDGSWITEPGEQDWLLTGSNARGVAVASFGSEAWRDYVVSAKVRLWNGILRVAVRNSSEGSYFVGLTPSNVVLYKKVGNGFPGVVLQSGIPTIWGEKITANWTRLRVAVSGGEKNTTIGVWLDDAKIMDWAEPTTTILHGSAALLLLDSTRASFDDLQVVKR